MLEDAYSVDDGTLVQHRGGGPNLSLVLSFALPSSCYATMLVRELLKGSTAAAEHKAASLASGGAGSTSVVQHGSSAAGAQ
jgi:hypothetical protein